jgi:hypothetical protein
MPYSEPSIRPALGRLSYPETRRTHVPPAPSPYAPPAPDLHPPSYGEPQRTAINSVIDNVCTDICEKVQNCRKVLDEIEQAVLTSAASAKSTLAEHISVCTHLNDELIHMRRIIEDIKTPSNS